MGAASSLRVDRRSLLVGSICFLVGAGTFFFNRSTFHALRSGLDANEYDRLVWTSDALGSICFLVSGCLAYLEV